MFFVNFVVEKRPEHRTRPSMKTEVYTTRSPAATYRLAANLVSRFPACTLLALHGNLGGGKTCFVQGLALALGVQRPVTSPTFTLVHEYEGARHLVHVDLYRIRSDREALDLGLEDFFEVEGIVAIEWAERMADSLPSHTIHLEFETLTGKSARRITVHWPE